MPVEQRSPFPPQPAEAVADAFASSLAAGSFALVVGGGPRNESPGTRLLAGRTVFAERNVRRVATHTGMVVSMGVLVGAGIALGAVDGLLIGVLLYTFPWFLVGLGAAGALWWRYGRTYESEVVAATLTAGVVIWNAGRVRSVLFAGVRTAVGVIDCPIPLMEGLGSMARRFEAQVQREGPPPTGTTAPSAS